MAKPDGRLIRELRKRKGMTTVKLARRAGVAERTLRLIERDETDNPQPETIASLAGALGVKPEEIFAPQPTESTAPGFGGAPAIAVLPFANFSGDPDQEYFVDGMTDQLITLLSNWGTFPVIARSSTFTYKGQSVDVRDVGRELGARYVVEGRASKAGDRVRISAQLIDGTTGHHVWAETYDRELQGIFAVQDEITESIVGSLYPKLLRTELERVARQKSKDLRSYDLWIRGIWHLYQLSKEDNAKARALFEQAIELDPSYADAWAHLSLTHNQTLVFQWTDDPAKSLEELERAAQRCVALDSESALCSMVLSVFYGRRGQTSEQLAALERAVELNPNFAMAHEALGNRFVWLGRSEEAIVHVEKALRLDPRSPEKAQWLGLISWAHFASGRFDEAMDWAKQSVLMNPDAPALSLMSWMHFAAGRYEESVDWAKQSVRANPDVAAVMFAHRALAASYAQLGRLDEARAAVAEELRIDPNLTLGTVRDQNANFDPDFQERYFDGLRKAGMPE